MLHNDTFNRREYVVSVILKVVDGYTVDEAVNVMQVLLFRILLSDYYPVMLCSACNAMTALL